MTIEAANLDEKLAWLAALNAHTQYVEASLKIGMHIENEAAVKQAAVSGTTAPPGEHEQRFLSSCLYLFLYYHIFVFLFLFVYRECSNHHRNQRPQALDDVH